MNIDGREYFLCRLRFQEMTTMASPIRTITFTADLSGVKPDQPQFAGVQGEHNATQVVFSLDNALIKPEYRYRFEYVDAAGRFDTTAFVSLSGTQAGCFLPSGWTAMGGTGVIRLCAALLADDGEEEQVVYTLSGRLKYASRNSGPPMEEPFRQGLSSLIQEAEDASNAANQAAQEANQATNAALDAAAAADHAAGEASKTAEEAHSAADRADASADSIQEKLENGDFIGPQGPPGPQGPKGDKGDKGEAGIDGVMTELSPGMFGLSVNAAGHLILTHNDNEPTPPLSIEDGRLIYTIS